MAGVHLKTIQFLAGHKTIAITARYGTLGAKHSYWCREGDSNPHNPLRSADFKSAASANFAIPACALTKDHLPR